MFNRNQIIGRMPAVSGYIVYLIMSQGCYPGDCKHDALVVSFYWFRSCWYIHDVFRRHDVTKLSRTFDKTYILRTIAWTWSEKHVKYSPRDRTRAGASEIHDAMTCECCTTDVLNRLARGSPLISMRIITVENCLGGKRLCCVSLDHW